MYNAQNWNGLVAMEAMDSIVLAQLREIRPGVAAGIYGMLEDGYCSVGDYTKAIELHTQTLAIAEEMGDRAVQGASCSSLGICYMSLGQYDKAIKLHEQL